MPMRAVLMGLVLLVSSGGAAAAERILALCYHDVSRDDPDQTYLAVSADQLVQQFNWLRREGFHPISIDDLLQARAGTRPLPDKPVLLSFDDGYAGFYSQVFPLLKLYGYPAVLALTGQWLRADAAGKVPYGSGNSRVGRELFVGWDQVREMSASGLVEIAAHSDALHRGINANPQQNEEPALTTAHYDPRGGYETAAAYAARLTEDARTIAASIERETGRAPRVMVWPYGSYNREAMAIYAAAGMPITLTLDDGTAVLDRLAAMPRMLVAHNPELRQFVADVHDADHPAHIRAVQVDLDDVYDADPARQAHNLDLLVSRVYALGVNVVVLQAFADPDGSGRARSLYFPNRWLPVRADLFNRVAWQLKTRANVVIYGWLPVLSYDFGALPPERRPAPVLASDGAGAATVDRRQYPRLSPFDPKTASLVGDLYEDLARAGVVEGLLFSDDAQLSQDEDASAPALEAYRQAGLPASIEAIRADAGLRSRWEALKTRRLTELTEVLTDRAGRYRLPLKTMRDIYARLLIEPAAGQRFAQDFDLALQTYDYVSVRAMPRPEGVGRDDATAWLEQLVAAAAARPRGLSKTVFELGALEWTARDRSRPREIAAPALVEQMRVLLRNGAANFGYYPDEFVRNRPDADVVRRMLSLQRYPYKP